MGVALGNLGRNEQAITESGVRSTIASLDKALEIKPDYDSAWNNRGIALGKLGRYEQAITESGVRSTIASLDKALEINPDKYNIVFKSFLSLRKFWLWGRKLFTK